MTRHHRGGRAGIDAFRNALASAFMVAAVGSSYLAGAASPAQNQSRAAHAATRVVESGRASAPSSRTLQPTPRPAAR